MADGARERAEAILRKMRGRDDWRNEEPVLDFAIAFNAAEQKHELLEAASTEDEQLAFDVAGFQLVGTIADFKRSASVCLAREAGKDAPDTRLVQVLCNAIRLTREHTSTVKRLLPVVAEGKVVCGTCETCKHEAAELSNYPRKTLCLNFRVHRNPTDGCTDHEPKEARDG